MKKIWVFSLAVMLTCSVAYSQTDSKYPDPEFTNEVYYLKKENSSSLIRLEKNSAKQENKASMIKGSEFGYSIEGKSATVRFSSGNNLSFIFSTGTSAGVSNSKTDSMMRANGMDPKAFSGFGGDPSSTITLYKLNIDGGERKIYLQKTGGALPFSNHKNQSSDKYTFSTKKVREGYWELVVDKPLPKGEYAFSIMGMGGGMGGTTVYAFGID